MLQTISESAVRGARASVAITSLIALVAFAGCQSETDTGGRKAIAGEITLNGAPLKEGSIRFEPKSTETAGGAPIVDGKYEIAASKGLLPGTYRVFIDAVEADTQTRSADDLMNNPGPARKKLIPDKYNTKSTLTVEVTESGNNHFDFPIDTKK
ncbi:hypothetical protein GC197_14090 [bacterium]|nr:hypothetical protein [bacterium]